MVNTRDGWNARWNREDARHKVLQHSRRIVCNLQEMIDDRALAPRGVRRVLLSDKDIADVLREEADRLDPRAVR